MLDMSDTKHFKTILVSNFCNNNRSAEKRKGLVVKSRANDNCCATFAEGMPLSITN
jgi:hypothetical protein